MTPALTDPEQEPHGLDGGGLKYWLRRIFRGCVSVLAIRLIVFCGHREATIIWWDLRTFWPQFVEIAAIVCYAEFMRLDSALERMQDADAD